MASLREEVRDGVRDCLDEYFGEEEEECQCECEFADGRRCPQVEDSDAAVTACIKALRERIDAQDRRIAELEKRPIGQIQYIPITCPTPLADFPDEPFTYHVSMRH